MSRTHFPSRHLCGHDIARHGAQRATRQQNAGLGVFAASVLGAVLESQGLAGAGQLAGQVSQTVAAGYIARYGRDQELQADSLGAEYLSRVKYDPRNMVDVITVLKNQERFAADVAQAEGRPAPARSDWLSSHPSNDQRLDTITQLANQYKGQAGYEDEGRARYLKVITGMQFGDSAEQGLVRGRNFYHPELGLVLTAPVGWTIQNDAVQLTVINAARDAAMVLRAVPRSAGTDAATIFRNVLKPTQGQTESTVINGLNATRFVGARQNAQGQTVPIEATLVNGPGAGNYLLQSVARDANSLQNNRASLRAVEGSFRALNAQDRNVARPWAIELVAYPRGGFAELARSSPLDNAQRQLRLINGFYAGGEPKVGQLVKVIEPR